MRPPLILQEAPLPQKAHLFRHTPRDHRRRSDRRCCRTSLEGMAHFRDESARGSGDRCCAVRVKPQYGLVQIETRG